jgi:type III pantothenate kinase
VILLVDAGNSAVKWGTLADDGTVVVGGREVHRDGSDLSARLQRAWSAPASFKCAVGCTVASADIATAVERAAAVLRLPGVEWLRSQPRFDGDAVTLVNRYRDPAQLGADRWHALLGACAERPRESLVVVHAGTATTVDCIRHTVEEAEFIGGCIAPGVRLMLESLARGTAGLPLADGQPVDFPDSTERAIVTGVFDAQAGLVERVWTRFAARAGAAPGLLVGGGHAASLAARLPERAPTIADNLVLRGLALRVCAR